MWNYKFFKWKLIILTSIFIFTSSRAQNEVSGSPCTVRATGSHLIVNIVESRGDEMSQEPDPSELPITGETGTDIELKINYPDEDSRSFVLEGKKLKLVKPLDRDAKDLASIVFQLTCTVLSTGKRKTIPLVVTISDLNDNAPKFVNTPYQVTIPESTPVDSVVFRGLSARDPDSNVNGQVEYFIENETESLFKIELPHQGIVRLAKPLDYESDRIHFVTIVASDRAMKAENRLSATTTLTVNVMDSDDLDPVFEHDLYNAKITSGLVSGAMEVRPEKIRASDRDTLRNEIRYTLSAGTPDNFAEYFKIDSRTGVVSQIASVSRDLASNFDLTITAEEISSSKRSATSRLLITVMAEDVSPPVLQVSATIGYVDENSDVGTKVVDENGKEIVFVVNDADRGPVVNETSLLGNYFFEMTTKSFRIDDDGKLVVNQKNLDRDPPNENKLSFQVFARELEGEEEMRKSSSPVTITVHLKDVNDNSPVLNSIKDVTLTEGISKRIIATLSATDNDSDKRLEYRLLSVSNNGIRKFAVDPGSGRVSVIGPVRAGEHYSLTVAALDSGGKANQAIMEVRVTAGPNLRGPMFNQFLYEATVNENSAKFARVVTVEAKDPESDPIRYSIVAGNEDEHFQIEEATGEVRVMKSLDRETQPRYSLTIRAEDNGGKFSNATLNVEVGDANDQAPEFVDEPYTFKVKEGLVGATVGQVKAKDGDIGRNAKIFYKVPSDSVFDIQNNTGEIRTRVELDFETQPVHYVVVTAVDDGEDVKKSSTATVTVVVQDTADEIPTFSKPLYEAKVPENAEDFEVITVMAEDKDTETSITYTILSGDLDKFSINPKTGVIKTLKGLDYEQARSHMLIIGTEEGRAGGASDPSITTCKVEVSVEDLNDVQPVFVKSPHFVQVRNDARVGEKIGTVQARDSDGTAPGNIVKYELVESGSSEKALQYFRINPESGEIEITDDLTQELFDEYKLEIRAFDGGDPVLDSTLQLVVVVKQVVTMPPESGMGFAELEHPDVKVLENSIEGTLIKTLEISQKPAREINIKCEIVEVINSKGEKVRNAGLFEGVLNDNKDCDIMMGHPMLDREESDSYKIKIKLNTLSAFANPERITATIDLTVLDKNDNAPAFVFDEELSDLLSSNQYLVSVQDNTPIGSPIIQIQARDNDSGVFGELRYSLSDAGQGGSTPGQSAYFTIDPMSGRVSTRQAFNAVKRDTLPFRLVVTVRDNPDDSENSKMEKADLVINLIRPGDGVVLTISNTPPDVVNNQRGQLMDILQEQTGLVIEIDQILASMTPFANGSCCRINPRSTDVYFHAVDPQTDEILPYNSSVVTSKVTGKQASSNLKYAVSGRLAVQASDIHPPYINSLTGSGDSNSQPVKQAGSNFDGVPAFLIAVGVIMFALAIIAIIYLCFIRRKYECKREKSPKMLVIPRYEPVFVEPSVKEYETQVLQMSVPPGDEDTLRKSSHMDRDYWLPFHLDNISYITKDKNLDSMSTMSTLFPSGQFAHRDLGGHYSYVESEINETPIKNPLFQRDTPLNHQTYLSASRSNDNVVFADANGGNFGADNNEFVSSTPRHKVRTSPDHIQSPIDSTTQL